MQALTSAAFALIWLIAIFIPLEWAFPAWPGQKRLRKGLATDLAFFAGQHLLFGWLVVWVFAQVLGALPSIDALGSVRTAFRSQPMTLQVAEAVMLGDFLMYWGHRAQHRFDLLWRFHSVHHSSEKLDFMAAHREHPLDGLYTQAFMNLPALLLGFSVEAAMGVIAFRGLWATFIHSNVRVPLGPFAMLLGSPNWHHLHHERDREAANYANLAPWIDWMFGTHRSAEETPADLGLDEPCPQTYVGLLVHPFRPHKALPPSRDGCSD